MTIPYIQIPHVPLPFGQKIDIFGVLSAIAVFVGAWVAAKEAKDYAKVDDLPLQTWCRGRSALASSAATSCTSSPTTPSC